MTKWKKRGSKSERVPEGVRRTEREQKGSRERESKQREDAKYKQLNVVAEKERMQRRKEPERECKEERWPKGFTKVPQQKQPQ